MKEARPEQIWTIPNVLTMIRLALIPLYWVLMVRGQTYQALAVYVAASLTDLADGYIARKYHQITNFGKLMDPVADKVMVLSVMLSMVLPLGGREPVLPWAPFIILLSKELLMILGGDDLFENLPVRIQNAGEIHHFSEAQNTLVIIEGIDCPVIQQGAGFIQRRGRYAGRQHYPDIHREAFRRLQDILNPLSSHNVGNFMRIGDHRGGAVGEHCLYEFRRRDERAFQMNVRVDETRQHDPAAHVDFRFSVVFSAYTGDEPVRHGDIAMAQFIAEHIYKGCIFQYKIRFAVACGNFDNMLFIVQFPVDPGSSVIRFHPATSV